ncbi:MAG: hypothetical protein M3443_04125 [Actinomycetota bacterium]|nr:hypothetical protein [Actinomycetota bacterium]
MPIYPAMTPDTPRSGLFTALRSVDAQDMMDFGGLSPTLRMITLLIIFASVPAILAAPTAIAAVRRRWQRSDWAARRRGRRVARHHLNPGGRARPRRRASTGSTGRDWS